MESIKYYVKGTVIGSKMYETYTEDISAHELACYYDEVQSFIAAEVCDLAQYIDDRYSCIQGVVIEITPGVTIIDGCMYSMTTITANTELNEEQKKAVLDYLSGQFSDGWGEGVEQRPFSEDTETDEEWIESDDDEDEGYCEEYDVNVEYFIHFWQSKNFKLEFVNNEETKTENTIPSKPRCKLIGADGNIFNLLGIAGRALTRAGMRDKKEEMQQKAFKAKSYDEALQIIMQYVEVE